MVTGRREREMANCRSSNLISTFFDEIPFSSCSLPPFHHPSPCLICSRAILLFVEDTRPVKALVKIKCSKVKWCWITKVFGRGASLVSPAFPPSPSSRPSPSFQHIAISPLVPSSLQLIAYQTPLFQSPAPSWQTLDACLWNPIT